MHKLLLPLIASAITGMLVGCATPPATTTPHLDAHFGEAVNRAKAQQTINPDASKNVDPVTGMTGKEGDLIIDKYHGSLKAAPAPATIINIGGGITGGGN